MNGLEQERSADILVRNAGLANTAADKNVLAPEEPTMRPEQPRHRHAIQQLYAQWLGRDSRLRLSPAR